MIAFYIFAAMFLVFIASVAALLAHRSSKAADQPATIKEPERKWPRLQPGELYVLEWKGPWGPGADANTWVIRDVLHGWVRYCYCDSEYCSLIDQRERIGEFLAFRVPAPDGWIPNNR